MTTSATTISNEIMKNWAQISKEVPKENFKLNAPKKEIERAYSIYTYANKTTFSFIVLGGSSIREDKHLINNLGTLSTDPQVNQKEMREFLLTAHNLDRKVLRDITNIHMTKGSILNESRWWILPNDMFMLGAVHGEREFHLACEKLPDDDLLWDKDNRRPRVLGRELLMLQFAGYQRIASSQPLGIVFSPFEPVKPDQLTLTAFRTFVTTIKSIDEIKKIFETTYSNDCVRTEVDEKAYVREEKRKYRDQLEKQKLLLKETVTNKQTQTTTQVVDKENTPQQQVPVNKQPEKASLQVEKENIPLQQPTVKKQIQKANLQVDKENTPQNKVASKNPQKVALQLNNTNVSTWI